METPDGYCGSPCAAACWLQAGSVTPNTVVALSHANW